MAERVADLEAEIDEALETAELPATATAVLAAAGRKPAIPKVTPFGPLPEGSTRLGPHDLCFLLTLDLDADVAQECSVSQSKSGEWVAEAKATPCRVACVDLSEN